MKFLDINLPNPAGNLALDEALLDACEEEPSRETLRFWESPSLFVVVGYSNQIATEVDEAACAAGGVGVFRRCSGGGTVLQGPGCVNYSVILNMEGNEALQTITGANCFVMQRQREALARLLGREVKIQGHTDLAVEGLKFSGNAQRRKRRALLFHGTFLLNFDLALMEKYLRMPSREPEYREGRAHARFVTNIPVQAEALQAALREVWGANETLATVPDYQRLVEEKYSRTEWNLKF